MKIYYNPELKERASELRKKQTFSERFLWKHLRSQQMMGYQFMRQKPIDKYIVDFYCSKLNLAIEIDGITHDGKQKYDNERETRLKGFGIEIIKFDGNYVVNNIIGTLQMITDKIIKLEERQPPSPLSGDQTGLF